MTRKSSDRSAGNTRPLSRQELHAGGHDCGHVEMSDASEQIAVQPRVHVGA